MPSEITNQSPVSTQAMDRYSPPHPVDPNLKYGGIAVGCIACISLVACAIFREIGKEKSW